MSEDRRQQSRFSAGRDLAVHPVLTALEPAVALDCSLDRLLTICQSPYMMPDRTTEGEIATEAILAVFRVNGLLLAAGDVIAAELGLTAARWQVLGAVALAPGPLTVPQIARRMGLTRQSVHETVKHLTADGLVEHLPNADHRRSPLVDITSQGKATYQTIDEKQAVWVNHLVAGLSSEELETTAHVLGELCTRLEAAKNQEEGDDE